MEPERFDEFQRELKEMIGQRDNLRGRLQDLLARYEIPPMTRELKTRGRKCKAPLKHLVQLSSRDNSWIEAIGGRAVAHFGGSFQNIYMCPELSTFQLKSTSYEDGNSRWGFPERSFTYCKLISPEDFVDLIAGPETRE